jgi:tetratricopeptide (TPR) repeat protein
MFMVPLAASVLAELWETIARLIDQGRRHDALVTLRGVAAQTGDRRVRITLGTLLAEGGTFHEAILEWTRVIDEATAAGDTASLAAVYHNLAAVYRELGDYPLARRFQQRCLALEASCGPEELLHLANDAISGRRWGLAEALVAAAEEATSEGDPAALSDELAATRGLIAAGQGRTSEARDRLRAVYRRHRDRGADQAAGKDLMNLAMVLEQEDRWDLARRTLRQAQRHCRAAADAVGLNRCHYLLRRVDRALACRRLTPACN